MLPAYFVFGEVKRFYFCKAQTQEGVADDPNSEDEEILPVLEETIITDTIECPEDQCSEEEHIS